MHDMRQPFSCGLKTRSPRCPRPTAPRIRSLVDTCSPAPSLSSPGEDGDPPIRFSGTTIRMNSADCSASVTVGSDTVRPAYSGQCSSSHALHNLSRLTRLGSGGSR